MPFFPQRHKNKIVIIFLSALLCLLLSSLWLLKRREGFYTLANDMADDDESNDVTNIVDRGFNAYESYSLDDAIDTVNKKPGEYLSNMFPDTSANAKADAALMMDAMLMDRLKANAIANGIAKERENVPLYPKGAKSIYIGDERYGASQADYDLNTIATDIINKNPYQKINWSTVEFDMTKNVKNTIGAIQYPSDNVPMNYPRHKVPIMIDSCSSLGILNSEFKTDICTTHAGDNITINEKCQELSATNCTLPSCCVLVNGTCMAGNNNGPTFSTHNGMTIDYNYYYYKDKCYGACGSDANQIRASKEAAILRAQAEAEAETKAKALAEEGDNKRAGRANLINSLAENPTAESTNSLLDTFKFSQD
jgi:V8-like Glu-specific endopeptidase